MTHEEEKNYLELADKHLGEIEEPTLLILKGHLLVEVALAEFVRSNMARPEFLDKANLRFYQLANLARAMTHQDKLDRYWDAVFALNAIRNVLAHQLDPANLQANFKKLFLFEHAEIEGLDDPDLPLALHRAFGSLTAFATILKQYETQKPR